MFRLNVKPLKLNVQFVHLYHLINWYRIETLVQILNIEESKKY